MNQFKIIALLLNAIWLILVAVPFPCSTTVLIMDLGMIAGLTLAALILGRVTMVTSILLAWVFGGCLEELVESGIVLDSVAAGLIPLVGRSVAVAVAVLSAALGAGLMHLYQAPCRDHRHPAFYSIWHPVLGQRIQLVAGHDLPWNL